MLQVTLPDVEATESLGAALAHEARRGDVLFLRGELGSGKTSLARGFMRRFFGNPSLDVPSPSYLLHFAYSSETSVASEKPPLEREKAVTMGAADANKPSTTTAKHVVNEENETKPGHTFRASSACLLPGCNVNHIDPYRLPEGKIASLIDFDKIFAEVTLVEWPDRLGQQIVKGDSPPRLEITFEGFGPQAEGRIVSFSHVGERWREVIDRWTAEGGPLRAAPSDPACGSSTGAVEASGVPTLPTALSSSISLIPPAFGIRNCRPLPEDPREWRVLGIESSCDDTGAAVVTGFGRILGEALASQAGIHGQWGGVVPKLAQEAHKKAIDATVDEALNRAGITSVAELSAVAVTIGPGLGLCLEVGVRKAMQIASAHRLPLVRVHHMEAHTLVTRLPAVPDSSSDASKADVATSPKGAGTDAEDEKTIPKLPELLPAFPFLTLLVSGGHNLAVLTRGIGRHTILGSTIDDSIGEAFDKTARVLGITQVPGGPSLERMAKEGDPDLHTLPKPLSKTRDEALRTGCDYSFSGLKTAVRSLIDKEIPQNSIADMPEPDLKRARADIAAAFQRVAVEHLCERASRAVDWAQEAEPSVKAIVVAGGVAANQAVRSGLQELASDHGLEMRCPPPRLCVDNGVMVAWAGVERLHLGLYEEPPSAEGVEHFVEIRPRWPLGDRDSRSHGQKQPVKTKGEKRKKDAQ